MLAAIPGLLVVLAGALLLVAGVALILVFVVPIYRIVRLVTGGNAVSEPSVTTVQDPDGPGRKAVESRVV